VDDLQGARRFFEVRDAFVITTHEGPDADGIGAEVVLAKTLRALGKRVRVVNATEPSRKYAFLDPEGILETYDAEKHSHAADGAALVVVDSADRHNLGVVSDELVDAAAELYAIDHHEQPKRDGIRGFIDTAASSTCELTVRLAEALGAPLDAAAARAAYAGIVYDTGSFI